MKTISTRGLVAGALLLAVLAASAGCSPEYTRVRGGSAGADVGNRTLGPSMVIHGPVNPEFGELVEGQAVQQSK